MEKLTATEQMSRSGTAANRWQGDFPRVVCICMAGILRAPTISLVLGLKPYNCNTRIAGSHPEYALQLADQTLLDWADRVVLAYPDIKAKLLARGLVLPENTYTLHVPDKFAYRDEKLIKVIRAELARLDFPEYEQAKAPAVV